VLRQYLDELEEVISQLGAGLELALLCPALAQTVIGCPAHDQDVVVSQTAAFDTFQEIGNLSSGIHSIDHVDTQRQLTAKEMHVVTLDGRRSA
jgi:uncharacterized protein YcfL